MAGTNSTTTGLPISPFPSLSLCSCLQLQHRYIRMSHCSRGKGLTVPQLSSPDKECLGCWPIRQEEDLGPEIVPCEILLSRSCGCCPRSHIAPCTEHRPVGTLTKGAHYFASHCCEVLLSMTANQRKMPTIKAWFNKIQAVHDSKRTVVMD